MALPQFSSALVVVGADPPLAGEELALVETVGKQVENFIVVLNKADRTTDAEREAASRFTLDLLQKRLQREVGPVFEISAKERTENGGPERDWKKLIEALRSLVSESGKHMAHSAGERGLRRLSEQLLALIGERQDALRRPLDDSENRIAAMKETLGEAGRSMRELSFVLMAEQQHLSDLLVGRHKAFLASVLPRAGAQFDKDIHSTPRGFGPTYRRHIMKSAQAIARSQVAPWLVSEQEEAEKQYREASLRFVDLGNDFLRNLAEADLPQLARMPHALDMESGFRVRSRFTFLEYIELAQPASPFRWIADMILPLLGARKLILEEGREFLARLLETNSTRVQSDILNRVQESRSRLEVEIRKLLHEVTQIAEEALIHARRIREEGETAVREELNHLSALSAKVYELIDNNAGRE